MNGARIACFSMEIGVSPGIPSHGGGSGVLAGGAAGWARVMKGAIAKNASFGDARRMMRRYVTHAYL